jgi:hypothetical protein
LPTLGAYREHLTKLVNSPSLSFSVPGSPSLPSLHRPHIPHYLLTFLLFPPGAPFMCCSDFTKMEDFDTISESHSKQNPPPKALMVVNKHELAYATQGLRKPWKPLSFSSGILVSFALFTAGLAAMLGVFQWQNSRNGALLFAGTGDAFSSMDAFLYRFCPTIIVVFYSIAWSWIDLDIKRLEPWFQLAQTGGSSARASLLSHYPVDFLPLVPFKAAQRRSVAHS